MTALLATGAAMIWGWLARLDRGDLGASHLAFPLFGCLAVALWAITVVDLL
jgi:hypothetical protein